MSTRTYALTHAHQGCKRGFLVCLYQGGGVVKTNTYPKPPGMYLICDLVCTLVLFLLDATCLHVRPGRLAVLDRASIKHLLPLLPRRLLSFYRGAHNRSGGTAKQAIVAALLLAVAVACLPAVGAWEVQFGDCTFRNGESDELLRSGSCPEETGTLRLDLNGGRIRSLTPGVFDGMAGLE